MAKSNFLPIFLTVGLLAVGGGAYYLATKKEGEGTELKIPTLDEIIAYITGLFGGGGGNGNGNGNGDGDGNGNGNGTPSGAAVTTNKPSYKKGETINVTGTGYGPSEKIRLDLSKDGGGTVLTVADRTTDSAGKFTGTLTANTVGDCWVNALGRTSTKFAHKKIAIGATTAPPPPGGGGTTSGSITIGAAGDWGSGRNSNWQRTADQMIKQKVNVMLGLGDYSYTSTGDWQKVIDRLKKGGILINRIAEGNHDSSSYAKTTGQSSMLMGFDAGNARIIILNTESGASTNASFAEKELKATKKPWKIFIMHKCLYTNDSDHGPERSLANALKPLINKYGVQLAMFAHNHNYQRIVKSDQPKCVFICSGTGGESHYDLKASESGTKYMNDNDFGFTKLVITSTKLSGQFINTSGTVKDSWSQTLSTASANVVYAYQTMEARISA